MVKASNWHPTRIERYALHLGETEPIGVEYVTAAETGEGWYDMHYGLELGIMYRGGVQRLYSSWETTIGSGDVWLCGMWEPHGWTVLELPCEALVVYMLPQALASTAFQEAPGFNWMAPFLVPPDRRPRVMSHLRSEVLALGRRIAAKAFAPNQNRSLWLRVLCLELLLLLQERWEAPALGYVPPFDSYAAVERVLQEVSDTRTPMSLGEAARIAGMSRNTFCRAFSALVGLPFGRFCLRHRLSGAAAELLRGQAPVKTVARRWGFRDGSHLHHAFRAHYGLSPAEYRERGSADERERANEQTADLEPRPFGYVAVEPLRPPGIPPAP